MDEGDEKIHQRSGDDGQGKAIWRTGLALTPETETETEPRRGVVEGTAQ
jgi:hypothetical protein